MPAKILTLKPPKANKKQVHFSKSNSVQIVYPSPMPELSMGSLSPPSPGGMLITPPLYTQGLPGPTPYGYPISPSKSSAHLRLHPFLQVSSSPPITYDLIQPTSTLYSSHYGIPRAALCEPATSPSVQTLTVVSHRLPWAITISPSTYPYVCVIDVLGGIYRALREGVTHYEFNSLPTDRETRRISKAYEERYRRIRSQREYQDEKSRGVLRVDFLMEYTKFRGLSPASGRDAWVLNTA